MCNLVIKSFSFFLFIGVFLASSVAAGEMEEKQINEFTKDYRLEDCKFLSEGETPFFNLKPGFQLVLEGEEDGKSIRFLMEVLPETKDLNVPGIGMVTTRVVQEKEWADGKPMEHAKSYFAICDKTNDLYDFGDEVQIFNEDGTVSTDGTWHAGEPDKDGLAKPGIFIPGTFLLGARYYQQLADGMSMERGENIAMGLTIKTKAGTFEDCVKVLETNETEGPEGTVKTHCPGIGLVGEDTLALVKYGYNIVDENGQ